MKRLYSDKELGALIQRATELQAASEAAGREGLSLQEIEGLASELGIEAAHLREAARDLELAAAAGGGFRWLGGPFLTQHERVLDGTLTDEAWELVVHELRSETGGLGRVGEMGRSREWTRSLDGLDVTHLSLSPDGEQTTLRLRQNYRPVAVMAYVGACLVGGAAAGAVLESTSGLSDGVLLGTWAVCLFGACSVMRMGLAAWSRRKRDRAGRLVSRVAGALSSGARGVGSDTADVEALEATRAPRGAGATADDAKAARSTPRTRG